MSGRRKRDSWLRDAEQLLEGAVRRHRDMHLIYRPEPQRL
jgi:hypothetical protein